MPKKATPAGQGEGASGKAGSEVQQHELGPSRSDSQLPTPNFINKASASIRSSADLTIPPALKRTKQDAATAAPVPSTEIIMPGQITSEKAKELRPIADRIRARIRRSTEDIFAIGEDLLAVKKLLSHGRFTKWIEAEFDMTDRTAQNFMRVAERLGSKTEIISVLPPTTLYKLSAKSTPDEVVTKVVSDLEAGKTVKPFEVDLEIKKARLQPKPKRSRKDTDAARKTQERKAERDFEKRQAAINAGVKEALAILGKLGVADGLRLVDLIEDLGIHTVKGRLLSAARQSDGGADDAK